MSMLVVLAGVLVPAVAGQVDKSKRARGQQDLREIADAFNRYRNDTGTWPNPTFNAAPTGNLFLFTSLQGFACLYQQPSTVTKGNGPYFSRGVLGVGSSLVIGSTVGTTSKGVLDPWGRPYMLLYLPGSLLGGGMMLYSMGPNGSLDWVTIENLWGTPVAGDDLVQVIALEQ